MNISFECQYCGHKWDEFLRWGVSNIQPKCVKCGDKNVKAKKVEEAKIDTYVGCPPFEKTSVKTENRSDNNDDNEYPGWSD